MRIRARFVRESPEPWQSGPIREFLFYPNFLGGNAPYISTVEVSPVWNKGVLSDPFERARDGYAIGMSVIEKSIEVDVPIRAAYNQWTQFETFPHFMEGVERVEQLTDTRTHWKTKIAGVTREFDAEITRQEPEHRIEWCSLNGPDQMGTVTFAPIGTNRTLVNLAMQFRPEGAAEKLGDATNMVERRVEGDLERFKEFIEQRGQETGGWRGNV